MADDPPPQHDSPRGGSLQQLEDDEAAERGQPAAASTIAATPASAVTPAVSTAIPPPAAVAAVPAKPASAAKTAPAVKPVSRPASKTAKPAAATATPRSGRTVAGTAVAPTATTTVAASAAASAAATSAAAAPAAVTTPFTLSSAAAPVIAAPVVKPAPATPAAVTAAAPAPAVATVAAAKPVAASQATIPAAAAPASAAAAATTVKPVVVAPAAVPAAAPAAAVPVKATAPVTTPAAAPSKPDDSSPPPAQIHATVNVGKPKPVVTRAPSVKKPTPVQRPAPAAVQAPLSPASPARSIRGRPAAMRTPEPLSPGASSSLTAANFDFDSNASLSQLQDSYRQMRSLLSQRDAENAQLAEALLTLQEELQASESGGASGLNKELIRKNREAGVLLAKERAKHSHAMDALRKELEEARAAASAAGGAPGHRAPPSPKKGTFAFGSTNSAAAASSSDSEPPSVEQLELKLRESQQSLAHVQKQFFDRSTELTNAQQKVKQLARALAREIDEEKIKPESVLDEAFLGKFKGRAQKITLLQSKVRELEKQLKSGGGAQGSSSTAEMGSRGGAAGSGGMDGLSNERLGSGGASSASLLQDAHETALVKLAQDKKADLAQLRDALEAKNAEVDSLRKKGDAARARRNVLEAELRQVREGAKALFDKSAQDDALIDSLKALVEKLQKEAAAEKSKHNGAEGGEAASPTRAASKVAKSSAADAAKLAEQERQIAQLREQLRKAQTVIAAVSPDVLAKLRAYVDSDASTHVSLQRLETDKYRELAALHDERITQLEQALREAAKRQAQASSSTVGPASKVRTSTLPAARGARPAASTSSSSAAAAPESVATLKSQLASALSEAELVRSAYANSLASKEQDIAILQDIVNQKNELYSKGLADMKRKFQELTHALQ